MDALVECLSDYTYAGRPIALTWQSQRLEILVILAEWRTPDQKFFRVRTKDGREFRLSYREATQTWQIDQP